jgi:hypothetical protein
MKFLACIVPLLLVAAEADGLVDSGSKPDQVDVVSSAVAAWTPPFDRGLTEDEVAREEEELMMMLSVAENVSMPGFEANLQTIAPTEARGAAPAATPNNPTGPVEVVVVAAPPTLSPVVAIVDHPPGMPFAEQGTTNESPVAKPVCPPRGETPFTANEGTESNATIPERPTSAPSRVDALEAAPPLNEDQVFAKCGLTLAERSGLILYVLKSVSTLDDLLNVTTPQYQALQWLDQYDTKILCPTVDNDDLIQRYIAALLYFALGGPQWGACVPQQDCPDNAEEWLSEAHECSWFGLQCNLENGVDTWDHPYAIAIVNLTDNNLSGDIPLELFELSYLTGLTMDHNKKISGSIPDEIANLKKLIYINMDDNQLTGTLPSVLYSMSTLKALDLNANQLSGTLSDDIGNLSSLMVLQLEDNQFSGPLPTAGLARLEDLCKCWKDQRLAASSPFVLSRSFFQCC